MTNPYKPMSGRPGRLNCETTAEQSASGKRGGQKKLDANQIEALWDETQARVRATFYWKAPKAGQCVHADEPKACYRVRCQLGNKCVDDDMSPRRAAEYGKAPEVAK